MAVYVDIEFAEGRDARTLLKEMDAMRAPIRHLSDEKSLQVWHARYRGGGMTLRQSGSNSWRATVRTTGEWQESLGSFLDALVMVSIHEGVIKFKVDLESV